MVKVFVAIEYLKLHCTRNINIPLLNHVIVKSVECQLYTAERRGSAGQLTCFFFVFFCFFYFIQFNVPFKIISLIETSQSIGGRNGRIPGKPPDTPASRTWLVSHVASAGLEPTPDTVVR